MGALLAQKTTTHRTALGDLNIPDSYLEDDPDYYPEMPEDPQMSAKEWNTLTEKEKEAWKQYSHDQNVKIREMESVYSGIDRIEKVLGRPATAPEVDFLLKAKRFNRVIIDDGNDRTAVDSGFSTGNWLSKNPGIAAFVQPAPYEDDNYFVVKRFSEAERKRLENKTESFTVDDMLKFLRLHKRIHINDKGQTRDFVSEENFKEWLLDHPGKLKDLERNKTGSSVFYIKKPIPQDNKTKENSTNSTDESSTDNTTVAKTTTNTKQSFSVKDIPTWAWVGGGVLLIITLNR